MTKEEKAAKAQRRPPTVSDPTGLVEAPELLLS